jgi:hypothetical protein
MSPFDMAAFAAPISFIIANLPGLSGIALLDATSLAMFSLVQAVFWAKAGLKASAVVTVIAVTSSFIFILPGRTMQPELKVGKGRKSSSELDCVGRAISASRWMDW